MKILVFSDSHNNINDMLEITARMKNDISLIVHLGDLVSDLRRLIKFYPDIPYVCIKGNNDYFEQDVQEECVYDFQGVRFLFTHGNKYGVKSDLLKLFYRAKELSVNVVLFGHTHIPSKTKKSEIIFLNPGTIGKSFNGCSTFSLIEINEEKVVMCEILTYNSVKKEIDFWRTF